MAGAGLAAVWPPSPVPFPPSRPSRARPLPPWSQVQTAGRGAGAGPGSPGAAAGGSAGGPPAPAGLHGECAGAAAPSSARGLGLRGPPLALLPAGEPPPPRRDGARSSRDAACAGMGLGSTGRGAGSEGLVQPVKGIGMGPVRPGKGFGPVGPELGWVRMGLGSGWEGCGRMELGVGGKGALVRLGGLVQAAGAALGLGPGWAEVGSGRLVPALGCGTCWGSGWWPWVPLGRRVLGTGSIWLEGPEDPRVLLGRRLALPLCGWGCTSATRNCSISNGDFPYLLVFAGGLEPRKRLAFPARQSRL